MFPLVQFPGGYLFHYWLLCCGPAWVVQLVKECLEVLLPNGSPIFKIRFSQAKRDPDPDLMALLLQMSQLRSSFLPGLLARCDF